MTTAESLIERLSDDLKPVRPISPWRRGAALILGAATVVAAATLIAGFRPDLQHHLTAPSEVVQWSASVATGATALLTAALLAQPDRSRRWVWLPVPAGLLWISSLGLGCAGDLLQLGPSAPGFEMSWGCLKFILLLGLPLSLLCLWALRHAWPLRAVPVAVMAGLGTAGFCSAGLSLFHHLNAALAILISHGLATVLVMLIAGSIGRSVSRWS